MSDTPLEFTAYSLAELRLLEFPQHTWVIDELLPAGSLTLLVGRPKVGKSLMAIDMLASVAMGEPFAGRATTRSHAIYGSAEDALSLVRERLEARLGPEEQASLLVIPFDGSLDQWLRLDHIESFKALARTVVTHRPGVLVLDPLCEIHNQPENDADAMASILRPLRQLAHESNCAIVVVHHRNKYGSDPTTAARGSTAITGSVDQTITLDVADFGDSDPGASLPVTMFVEGRYGPRERLTVQLGAGFRWDLIAAPLLDTSARGQVLAALAEHPEGLSQADLAGVTELAARTIHHQLHSLRASGVIERLGSGRRGSPYRYRLSLTDERE